MQQIYNFEANHPPVLTEQILRQRIEQHKLKQHTILLAISGLLLELLIFLTALLLLPEQPVISLICISYNIISIIGGSMLTFTFIRRRRTLLCQM